MTVPDLPGTTTIALEGEYDIANAASILGQVSVALAGGARSVVVDAAGVTFMDSTALNALVQALRLCQEAGTTLRIARPSSRALRILQLSGLDGAFGISASGT